MKKKIIISLIFILVIGLILAIIPQNNKKINQEEVSKNLESEIIQSGDSSEKINQEEINITTEEFINIEDWISGDNNDLTKYFEGVDYSKITRKDEAKELVYEKLYEYVFQGAKWEDTIPVVNLNSSDADKINEAIESTMSDCYSIEYKIEIEDEILTLYISEDHEETTAYKKYKINMYTGKIN